MNKLLTILFLGIFLTLPAKAENLESVKNKPASKKNCTALIKNYETIKYDHLQLKKILAEKNSKDYNYSSYLKLYNDSVVKLTTAQISLKTQCDYNDEEGL